MDFSRLNSWLQVSANIGIVLGLVAVGVQLKQNADLTRVQLLYEESNRVIDLELRVVGEQAAEVWAKSIDDPENLTLAEIRIMDNGIGLPEERDCWTLSGLAAHLPAGRYSLESNLSEEELDQLVDFFRWADSINTQDWPPHPVG